MSEASVREATRLLREGDDARRSLGVGATEEEIKQAEARLGIDFPSDYRIFLSENGYGGYGSLDIMGLKKPGAIATSEYLVDANAEARIGGLPPSILLIENGGDGSFFAIDLTPGPNHGCVVVWPLGGDEHDNLDIEAADFGDYLLSSMQVAIEASPTSGRSRIATPSSE